MKGCPMADGRPRILFRRRSKVRAENRVAEIVGQALTFEERQIAMVEITFPPAKQPGIQSNNNGGVARVLGPAQQTPIDLWIFAGIELEPTRLARHGGGHLF